MAERAQKITEPRFGRLSPWIVAAILTAIVGVASFARIHRIGSEPFWLDETYSADTAAMPLLAAAKRDPTQPPLYYVLLHLWSSLGEDERTLRMLSWLLSVATVPFVFAYARILGGAKLGLLAAGLFAIAPFQVRYAQEARMYALLGLEAAVALFGMALVVRSAAGDGPPGESDSARNRRGWRWYAAGTAPMLWTQYISLLFVLSANACFAVAYARCPTKRRELSKSWLWAHAAVLLVWAPVIPLFVAGTKTVVEHFWIPPVDAARVVEVIRSVYLAGFLPQPAAWAGASLLVAALAGAWRWRREPLWLACCVLPILLPLGAEIASAPVRSVLLERTLVWTGIPFTILVANGLLGMRPGLGRLVAGTALVAVVAADLSAYYSNFRKEAWDEAAAHVTAHADAGDLAVFDAGWLVQPFARYYPADGPEIERFASLDRRVGERTIDELRARVRTAAQIWLVQNQFHSSTQDPDGKVLALLRSCCHEAGTVHFHEIDLHRFVDCR